MIRCYLRYIYYHRDDCNISGTACNANKISTGYDIDIIITRKNTKKTCIDTQSVVKEPIERRVFMSCTF